VCERIPFLILPVKQLSREPSGKTPGPSRIASSAEAPRASRRARRRARLESHPPPKRRERAVGQDAGPVSNRILRRSAASEPSGKTPGPSRIESSAEAPRASRRARRRARLESNPPPKRRERAVGQDAGPASNHPPKRYTSDPSSKPLPRSRVRSGAQAAAGGRRRYRTEPLRLFAVNPLTVGELGRRVIGEVILV